MALPPPVFPGALFDGNEQDTINDGAPDPKKFQAADYNEHSAEIIEVQERLRD